MIPFTLHNLCALTLTLFTLLTPSAHAQADFMFAYYLENTQCRAHVPPGSAKSQAIPTLADGQCVPVANSLGGTFDVRISGKIYWTNGVTPAIKACPTVDCDLYPDNGCYTMWDEGKWPGLSVCRRMTETFYWAVGPMGFNLKERQMRNGERYNGTHSNATDAGLV